MHSTRRTAIDPRAQLLVFASGLCALTYQTLWIRELRLLFGASTSASAAVLAIFMGGLGLGASRLAPRAEAHPKPLVLYAKLEAGVALLALASMPLLALSRHAYIELGGEAALGTWAATSLRLALASLVLGGPAFLMGGSLPAIVRAAFGNDDPERTSVARLYGLNTLGAVVGVLVTTFWALERLGLSRTFGLAAALNFALAAAAWGWARSSASRRVSPPTPDRPTAIGTSPALLAQAGPSSTVRALVLAAAAIFGFTFFAMELVWYRVLAPLTGGTVYGFALVLVVALAGIGLGGLAYELRRPQRPGLQHLALSAAIEATAIVFAWGLGDQVPMFASQLRAITILGPAAAHVYAMTLSAALVLPAALVAGYQFPLLVASLGRGTAQVSAHVGRAYAINTVGAVVGAIATGFGLLSLVGVRGVWAGCVLLLVGLSVALTLADRHADRSPVNRALGLVACIACAITLAFGAGPSVIWMHSPIGAGRLEWREEVVDLRSELEQARADLVWAADGKESSVAILGRNSLSFRVNGKTDGNATGDAATVIMAPLIAAAIHPEPQRGLVIGLGTGMSAGWLAQVDSMQHVDVVELEPALLSFARMCAPVNANALENPKLKVSIGDAREWVQSSDARWDVVMSEPSNPYRSGVASLFSVDFYGALSQHMNDDGVFVQWLQGYEIDALAMATVLASLREVFASVDVFATSSGDYALVARRSQGPIDIERLEARLSEEPYASAMAKTWGVSGAEGLLAAHLAGPALAEAFWRNPKVPREHDDRPRLEFGLARTLGSDAFVSAIDTRRAAIARGAGEAVTHGNFDRDLRDEARHVLSYTMENDLRRDYEAADAAAQSRQFAREAAHRGDEEQARKYWVEQAQAPRFLADQLMMGAAWASDGDWIRAKAMIDAVQAYRPVDAQLLRARLAHAQGKQKQLVTHLLAAFRLAQDDPWFQESLMRDSLRRLLPAAAEPGERPQHAMQFFVLLATPFSVDVLGETRLLTRLELGREIDFTRLCVDALAPFEPHPPFQAQLLEDRVRCYGTVPDMGMQFARAQRALALYASLSEVPTLASWLGEGADQEQEQDQDQDQDQD